ncbi:MAG: carboxypeptidase regulatory-like domain-containing protein [Elusimicrobia bacterium]|nr:carboxypeptidase regulatory-like domain-containing protein [Candidatus Obscuribacterium magneticum]MCB4755494.1 carboxypeptidase regulatory-like domain-containing protein [Candidatus Obscuribacterium magneticum]
MGKLTQRVKIAALLTLFIFLPIFGVAAVRTWDGGGASQNWDDPSNWNPDGIPFETDDVVFDATSNKACQINISTTVNNFSMNAGSSATVTIAGTNKLTVNGNVMLSSGTLNGGLGSIDVKWIWNKGTLGQFIAGNSTVTFISVSSASIINTTTFYALKAVTPGTTLYFAQNKEQCVTYGVDFEDVFLRSATDNSTWYFKFSGSSQTLKHLFVKDSNALSGFVMDADSTSIDGGNNRNWTFGSTHTAPGSFTISTVTTNSIKGQWAAVSSELGYTLEASSVAGFTGTISRAITTDGGASSNTISTGLTGNTTYFVRVGSRWNNGTTNYASSLTTSTLAGFPTSPSVFKVNVTSVAVTWGIPGTGAEGYLLNMSSTNFDGTGILHSTETFDMNMTTLTVTDLLSGTTYWIRVASLNHLFVPNFTTLPSTKTLSQPNDIGERHWISSGFGYWNDPNNWAFTSGGPGGAGVPLSTHTVIFNPGGGSMDLDTNVTVSTWIINSGYSNAIYTAGFAVTVSSYFKQMAGTVNCSTSNVTMKGIFEHSGGSFGAMNSTVTFEPGQVSRLIGDTTFYSLRAVTAGTTLYFQNYQTIAINNMVHFEKVTLRSSTDNNPWYVKFMGSSQTIVDVNVRDSNASSGATMVAGGTSTNMGNNVNWSFPGSQSPPGSPTISTVTVNSIRVHWVPVSSEKGYVVLASTDSNFISNVQKVTTSDGNASSATVSSLNPNRLYYLKVGSLWNDNTTSYTSPFSTSTWANLLVSPGVTAVYPDSIKVSWGIPSFGSNGYLIQATTDAAGKGVIFSSMTYDVNATTLMVVNLNPGTTYYVGVASLSQLYYPNFSYLPSTCTKSVSVDKGERYWVSDSFGYWNNPNNWSLTSDGQGGAGVPLSTHTVIFDGGGTGSMDLDVGVTVSTLVVNSNYPSVIYTGSYAVTISSAYRQMGGVVNWGNSNVVMGGVLEHIGGSYGAMNSTVTLVPSPENRLSGNTTFYSLKAVASGNTIFFKYSDTFVVNNMLDFEGVMLMSTNNGSRWNFKFYGSSRTLINVNVKDSDASGGQTMAADGTSINSGNNINWTFGSTSGTALSPYFSAIGITSLNINWNFASGCNYTAALSTVSNFSTMLSSYTDTYNYRYFTSLSSDTVHYFKVKVATEPDTSYNTPISTKTLVGTGPGVPTPLNPYFTFVGMDVINVQWTNVPGNSYLAVLSSAADFATVTSSQIYGNNFHDYSGIGLQSSTSYYFKVKITSETDASYNTPISTKTQSPAATGQYALRFNRTDQQFVNVPHSTDFDFQGYRTIEFWFKRSTTSSGSDEFLVGKDYRDYGTPANSSGWGVYLQPSGMIRFEPHGGGGGISSYKSINDMNWHHFALARDYSGYTYLYLDGFIEASYYTGTPVANSYSLKFGNSNSYANGFSGRIDEVRLWSTVRTENEIRSSRFQSLTGSEPNLLAYWDFNEGGTSQIVGDRAPNHRNGWRGYNSSLTYEVSDPLWDDSEPIPGFGAPPDTTPPQVKIFHPLAGSTQTVATLLTLSGTAEDNQSLMGTRVSLKRLSDGRYWHPYYGTPGGWWGETIEYCFVGSSSTWSMPGGDIQWSTGTSYEFVAIAEDYYFNSAADTSTFVVGISTDQVSPNVLIQYPVHGSTYTSTQLSTLSGTASDNEDIAKVSVRLIRLQDGKEWDKMSNLWKVGQYINEAYGYEQWQFYMAMANWEELESSYTMIAIALDLASNQASSTVTFRVSLSSGAGGDSVAPQLAILHPQHGSTHPPHALVNLSGTASDNVSLMEVAAWVKDISTGKYWCGNAFSCDAENWFYMPAQYNWNFTWISSSAWQNGRSYRLMVRARDGNNNYGYQSSDFNVYESTADTIPPFVTIQHPVSGTNYASPTWPTFDGNAGDNMALQLVEVWLKNVDTALYYNGVSFSSATPVYFAPNGLNYWTFTIPGSAFQNGNYVFFARAKDTSNNQKTSTVTFSVSGVTTSGDSTPPIVMISSPVNGATYTNGNLPTNLKGTASDNIQVSEVNYSLLDGEKYWDGNGWNMAAEFWNQSSMTVSATTSWYAYVPPAAWKNGYYIMRARARDSSNSVAYSSISFSVSGLAGGGSVDTTGPSITIYNPNEGANQGPYSFTNFNGRADDSYGVNQVAMSLRQVGTGMYWNGAQGFTSPTEFWKTPPDSLTPDAQGAAWSFNLNSYLYTNGSYVLRIRATDPSGNPSDLTRNFTVNGAGAGAGDYTAPTMMVLFPQNNQSYNSSQLAALSGTAADNVGVTMVELLIRNQDNNMIWDGATWRAGDFWMVANSTNNWQFYAPMAMWSIGSYAVTVRVKDAALNQISETVMFTVTAGGGAGIAPSISVAFPLAGLTYVPSSLTILSGSAADDVSVTRVKLRLTDLNLLQDWDFTTRTWMAGDRWFDATWAAGLWTFSQMPYWATGRYRITAQAEDNMYLMSMPQSVEFYVDNSTGGGGTDYTPPSMITDLMAQTGATAGSVRLSWTAPGDDGAGGTASGYIIKYRPGMPITTEADWMAAYDIASPPVNLMPPVPLVAGSYQSINLFNLSPGVAYYFAVRARDEAYNRGPISNNPMATAFVGYVAGAGDGQGTAAISPTELPEMTNTTLTLTFTVGAAGITQGGKIQVKIPDGGWSYPQTMYPASSGYVSAYASNQMVTLGLEAVGPMLSVNVQNGSLSAGDKVYISYQATPGCGVLANVIFNVLTQANPYGQPNAIASQPTLSITAGSAKWLGFDTYEKIVPLDQIKSIIIRGNNMCGNTAAVSANTLIDVAAVMWDNVSAQWGNDPYADLSLSSDLSSPFKNGSVTLLAGQSSLTLYYRLTSAANRDRDHVRIRYTDMYSGSYTTENITRIVPATGQGLSGLSVDTGVKGTAAQVTITPNNDGLNDWAFINCVTGDPNLSTRVEILTVGMERIWEAWILGSPVRVSWDGRRAYPYNDLAGAGTYRVRLTVGGMSDDSTLSIIVSASGVSGKAIDNVSLNPISDADVNVYGQFNRYTRTDANGDFSLVGIPPSPNPYTLSIGKRGYTPYQQSLTVTGSAQDLGQIRLKPMARLIVNATRSNYSPEIWGSIRARATGEVAGTLRLANGMNVADDGYSTAKPEMMLNPGLAYTVELNLPGYTLTPLQRTFSEGETYTWNVSLTSKKNISGQIRLTSGIMNATGIQLSLSAGVDAGGVWTPTVFTYAYIPPGEYQTTYAFPGLNPGHYRVSGKADGFTPLTDTVDIVDTDITRDFYLAKTGEVQLTITVAGDSTGLDTANGDPADGQFVVMPRLVFANGYTVSKAVRLNTHATYATSTPGSATFTGIPEGAYILYCDKLTGFELNPPGAKSVTVQGGVGSATLAFIQNTGSLRVTASLAPTSEAANIQLKLSKGAIFLSNPAALGNNQFQFSNLESGQYTLSAYDQLVGASDLKSVWVTNSPMSSVSVDLSGGRYYALSGTVRFQAAPPYHTGSSIIDNSTPLTIYTKSGLQNISALRIEAYMINPDSTIDSLPTTAGRIWDPAKIKFAEINPASGLYQISNLKEGVTYRLHLNTDFNNDGIPEAALEERILTLIADQTGVDFTLRDGAKLTGTLTLPASYTESGYPLTINLMDTILKQVVGTVNVAIVGTEATVNFNNLRIGSYLVQVVDTQTPPKYTAKPVFVTIQSASEIRSLSIALTRGAIVQGKLANKSGVLITSDNAAANLPDGFKIKLYSKGHIADATGPSADGTFTANILPETDYTLDIRPPAQNTGGSTGKSFLPITKVVKLALGQVYNWGIFLLESGMTVTGSVTDENGTPIANIPVFAYQSLARDLPPLKVVTDPTGSFTFEGLDTRIRFYDFVANPLGNLDSQTHWSVGSKVMSDLTKLQGSLAIVLNAVTGSVTGTVVPAADQSLVAAYGQYEGRPGVSLLVTKRGDRRILEFVSETNGTFNLRLTNGLYDIEILAKSHRPSKKSNVSVANNTVELGTINLERAVTLSGTVRNQDGSLPSSDQVSQILAFDAVKALARATLTKETVTDSVDAYAFYGLGPGDYTIMAVDKLGRPRVLEESFTLPDEDSTLDLTFTVSEPKLVASFMQKLPDGVETIFSCNQAFRDNPEDADNDGTSDDSEFADFIDVTQGQGTMAFTSVSADRLSANYLYTMGGGDGSTISSLIVAADFKTKETNPATGSNFDVAGTFTYPFGVSSSQEDYVTDLGADFVLPGGSSLSIPPNWLNNRTPQGIHPLADNNSSEGQLVKFRKADDLSSVVAGGHASGKAAVKLAEKLGPAFYPPNLYKAIRALSDAPSVNPFSSFYDIFLPQGVSRRFNTSPTITMVYDEGADPDQINVYYYNESQNVYTLENQNRRIDRESRTITVEINHASVFTVLESSVPIIQGSSYNGEVEIFNFPNPFDLNAKIVTLQNTNAGPANQTIDGTMIKFSVPVDVAGEVEIQIFNVAGEKVRTLRTTVATGGSHFYIGWDGANDSGAKVASGIYIGRFTIGGSHEKFFKMAVVK